MLICETASKPEHVPDELVRDFDIYNVPGGDTDPQGGFFQMAQDNPDIFWTPFNGGHWVATRAEDIQVMQRDTERFSYRNVTIPPLPEGTPRFVPLEVDPPENSQYRRPLLQALTPKFVREAEASVRQIAAKTIEDLVPLGECEFTSAFAKVLPIHLFLNLVDIPLSDKEELLELAENGLRPKNIEDRTQAQAEMAAYLGKYVKQRRANPGDDLLSTVVNIPINGTRISEQEAISYASNIMFGGLDTVAAMLAYFAKFFAEHPDHRREVVANLNDREFLSGVVEELIRRHGLANTARVVVSDMDYKGIHFREGDRVLPPNLLVGLDPDLNPDPLTVDFHRHNRIHAAFGNGAHACPGAILARRELVVFLEEWLGRIPDFWIKPGTKPVLATGQVIGMPELHLEWHSGL